LAVEEGVPPPEFEVVGSGEFEEAGLVVVVVLRAAASSDVVVIAIISDEYVPEEVFANPCTKYVVEGCIRW